MFGVSPTVSAHRSSSGLPSHEGPTTPTYQHGLYVEVFTILGRAPDDCAAATVLEDKGTETFAPCRLPLFSISNHLLRISTLWNCARSIDPDTQFTNRKRPTKCRVAVT